MGSKWQESEAEGGKVDSFGARQLEMEGVGFMLKPGQRPVVQGMP